MPLRPFTIGGLLDEPFVLFRRDLRLILLIAAVVVVPLQVLLASLQGPVLAGLGMGDIIDDPVSAQLALTTAGDQGFVMGWLISTAVGILVLPLINGLIARLAVSRVLGEQVDGTSIRHATMPRWGTLVGASVLTGLLTYGLIGLGVGIGVLWSDAVGISLAVILVLVGIPVGVAAYVLLAVTPVVVVVEGVAPVAALRRSAQLVRARFWSVLGVLLLAAVVAGLVNMAVATIPTYMALFTPGAVATVFMGAGELLAAMVTTPYLILLTVTVYLDARIRREGLDVEILADTARGGERASAG